MQKGKKRNVKVYMQLFNPSLYYFKFESFQLYNSPKWGVQFFLGVGGRDRDSLFLAGIILRNEMKT